MNKSLLMPIILLVLQDKSNWMIVEMRICYGKSLFLSIIFQVLASTSTWEIVEMSCINVTAFIMHLLADRSIILINLHGCRRGVSKINNFEECVYYPMTPLKAAN